MMKFGEKIRELRIQKGWTQDEMAIKLGVSKRTLCGYEREGKYPRQRAIYSKSAEIFNVDVNFLLTEGEEFVNSAGEKFGVRGRKQAQSILEQTRAMLAGGTLSEADELAFMREMQELYFDSKIKAKKYTPKKYLKSKSGESGM